jgi:hypothetical protein
VRVDNYGDIRARELVLTIRFAGAKVVKKLGSLDAESTRWVRVRIRSRNSLKWGGFAKITSSNSATSKLYWPRLL